MPPSVLSIAQGVRVTLTAPVPNRAWTVPHSSSSPSFCRCLTVYLIGVPSPVTPSTTTLSFSPTAQLVPLPPAVDFHEPSLANLTAMGCCPWVREAPVCQPSPSHVPVNHVGCDRCAAGTSPPPPVAHAVSETLA